MVFKYNFHKKSPILQEGDKKKNELLNIRNRACEPGLSGQNSSGCKK